MARKKRTVKDGIYTEQNTVWRFIGNLPFTLGVALLLLGSVNIVLLLLESFRTSLIFGIGVPVAIIGFAITNHFLSPESTGSIKERRIIDILAILLVIGWGLFNSSYNAQTVYLYRDPGLYNVTARWLISNDDIVIPAENPFGEHEQLYASSNSGIDFLKGENDDRTRLYTQGQRLLPTLSASLGRVSNEAAALKVNVAIGSLALLALYGFIRLFAKPRWALISTSVLATSLPMLYFSRDMYTEPLSMLFFFIALSLLYFAKRAEKTYLWLVSGLAAGAITLTRIDGYLAIAGLIIYLSIYLLSQRKKKLPLLHILFFFIGMAITSIIAWLDLTQLGTAYYRLQEERIYPQLLLILVVLIFGVLVNVIFRKHKTLKKYLKKINFKLMKFISIFVVAILFSVLLLRPLWVEKTSYYEIQEIGGSESIVSQKETTQNSITYDGSESVILWTTWYMGLLFSLFGLAGLFIIVFKVWDDKKLLYLPFLFSFLPVALLYFAYPNITPDHIWAARRFLPVIFPGVAFLAALALNSLVITKSKILSITVYVTLIVTFILGSISASGFFLKEKVDDNMLTHINQFCISLPDNSAVLLLGNLGLVGTQTIHSYCQVPTVRYFGSKEPSKAEFIEFYNNSINNGYVPVVASFYEDRPLFVDGSQVWELPVIYYKTVEKTFSSAPENMAFGKKQITRGFLNFDGLVRQKLKDKSADLEIEFKPYFN